MLILEKYSWSNEKVRKYSILLYWKRCHYTRTILEAPYTYANMYITPSICTLESD